MTLDFRCGDPATLAGYLYDECDAAERAAVESHAATCTRCAAELAVLGATRTALASWTPPEAPLGFQVTSTAGRAADVLRPAQFRADRWWQRPMPAWAQAAAAVLIFAAGAALGMRTGASPAPAAQVQSSPAAALSTVSADDLAALERRLRAEMQTLRTSAATTTSSEPAGPRPAQASEAAVVQRVRTLLAESEQRQQRELALRLTQVMRDVDAQRSFDLARIEQTFGQMEGFTRPELADQRQMINYLIQRTGGQRTPR